MEEDRNKPFDNILNFRDIGVSINQSCGRELLKRNLFFRSGSVDDCSKRDGDRLRVDYGIKTVLDLRYKRQQYAKKGGVYVPDDVDGVSTRKFLGITDTNICISTNNVVKAELRQLSWSQKFQCARYFFSEENDKIVRLLAKGPNGTGTPASRLIRCLDYAGERFKAIFKILADPGSYPILIHCNYGKQSTGLVALLVLALLGVSMADITADYMRSSIELESTRDKRIEEAAKNGYGPEWTDCRESWVEEILSHVESKYGGIEAYLESIGVERNMQDSIQLLLRAGTSEKLVDI